MTASIVLEAYMNDGVKKVGEYPLTELTGEVEFVPSAEMEWLQGKLIIQLESGIQYTGDFMFRGNVRGSRGHPEVVRMKIDREELRVGETATLTYEVENTKDLSTLKIWMAHYTEDRNYNLVMENTHQWDLEAAASGTVQITPEEAGILELYISFVDSKGYNSGAGIFGVRVTE